MNKTKLIAALLGGVILCASLLTGCAPNVKLKESGGKCVTSAGDITYLHASTCYVPLSLGDKCGTLEVSSNLSLSLHEIPNMDSDEWLATEEGDVLYAEGVALPTLSDMEPTAIYVYRNTTVPSKSAEILDADIVNRLTEACAEGETYTPSAVATYLVRFKSDRYPGILYSLYYVEAGDRFYLYDRWNGVSYAIDSSIRDALNRVTASTETTVETANT